MFKKIKCGFVLGDGLFEKAKLFAIVLWFPFKRIFKINRNFDFKVWLRYDGKKFVFYPTDGSDIGVLCEIFLDEEYSLPDCDPKIIVDVGSNVGLSVIYFKLKYPESKIYSFEPDPETFKKLQKNTEQFFGINLYNRAVSNNNGSVNFYVNPDSSMSSSMIKRNDKQIEIRVLSENLSDFLKKERIEMVDLLKFDIEGGEFSLFENFREKKKINHFVGEVHEDISGKTIKDFEKIFSGFKMENKRISPKRYIVNIYK